MKRDHRRDPRFDHVRAAALQQYLLSRGWRRTPFPRSEVLRFEEAVESNHEPVVLSVPTMEDLRDFPLRVEDIVVALSKVEDRPMGDILDDILAINRQGLPLPVDSADAPLTMPEARAEG